MTKYIDYKKLKAELRIVDVLSHYNIDHTKTQVQESLSCPFHDDKEPSFSVNKEKDIFRCFGCGVKGNALSFICLMEELNESDKDDLNQSAIIAVEKVLDRDVHEFSKKSRGFAPSRPTKEIKPVALKAQSENENSKESTINKPLTFSLDKLITDHPFIDELGFTKETIRDFGLGVCEKGIMKDRLVIPIHNANGELLAYSGRWLNNKPPENEGKYKLPKGFTKSLELFNQHRAKQLIEQLPDDEIIPLVIVEGFWSAMRLHEHGIPAVATFGADLSVEQAKAITRITADAVIVFDGDEAGREGTGRASALLAQYVFVKVVLLPEGEKPDTIGLEYIENEFI